METLHRPEGSSFLNMVVQLAEQADAARREL